MPRHRILLCSTCDPRPCPPGGDPIRDFGERVARALREADLDAHFGVEQVACMGACSQPVAMAIQGSARATYLFCGLDPAIDIADVVATCRTYLAAPDGWIEDARSCGRLRLCLAARIPRFDPG